MLFIFQVFDLELKADITGGRKYTVALLDIQQNPIILLNKELVIHGEANWRMEEKEWLDNICDKYWKSIEALEQNNNDLVSEEEENWDKCVVNCSSNNNNNVGLNRSSASTHEEQLNTSSSIVDEQLRRLYDIIQDEDNIEICDSNAMLIDMFNLPVSNANLFIV